MRIDDAALRNGLERVARVNRDTDEVDLVKLRDAPRRLLQMDESVRQPRQVPPATGVEEQDVPNDRWGKGPGRLVVQQMLLGLRPARYHDADRPTSLMDMMELQLDKFEASEETWV